jgi:hypothetical protein
MISNNIAEKIDQLVDDVSLRLRTLDEDVVSARPAEAKWSIKEIVGHLFDSAVNNHHRFVRANDHEELVFPGYEQNVWVSRQNYQATDWPSFLELWRLYNHQLAHVIRQIPEDRLYAVCLIGDHEPVTMRFLVEDYLDHMEHHLQQVDVQSAV